MTSGVYCITNLVTGAQYVGRAKRIEERYRQHIFALTSGSHNNKRLLEDWKNYKAETFRFQILEECCDRYLLSSLESAWIARLQPEYNVNSENVRASSFTASTSY
ncbi:GIY-YIG nuclease family protein [Trichocoleus desertorum AS-A10]|uniref:GIY-YIG nuclease family protein n=1 Tax=Trichocoleus desertorum TaxID=1481672 RepID=UPI00329944AE